MFISKLSQTPTREVQTFSLLVNPSTSTKAAKYIFFALKTTDTKSSIWEIYLGPVITNNGILQTVLNLDQKNHTDTNSLLMYSGPTISSYGRLARKFILPNNTQEFSTNAPTLQLEPGNSILLRRITPLGGKLVSNWRWEEVDTQN